MLCGLEVYTTCIIQALRVHFVRVSRVDLSWYHRSTSLPIASTLNPLPILDFVTPAARARRSPGCADHALPRFVANKDVQRTILSIRPRINHAMTSLWSGAMRVPTYT